MKGCVTRLSIASFLIENDYLYSTEDLERCKRLKMVSEVVWWGGVRWGEVGEGGGEGEQCQEFQLIH